MLHSSHLFCRTIPVIHKMIPGRIKYIASTSTHTENGAEFKVEEYLAYPVVTLIAKHTSNTIGIILQNLIIFFFTLSPPITRRSTCNRPLVVSLSSIDQLVNKKFTQNEKRPFAYHAVSKRLLKEFWVRFILFC